MREVDRLVVEEYGIDLVRMMENAGRSLADLAITRFQPATVTVLAGTGGNGGGGLVAARHLSNRGVHVTVAFTRLDPAGVPGQRLQKPLPRRRRLSACACTRCAARCHPTCPPPSLRPSRWPSGRPSTTCSGTPVPGRRGCRPPRRAAGSVLVRVVDRGRGFVPAHAVAGRGIRDSICGRMRDVGGVALFESSPDQGTCVEVRWPT
jgi:hypothetical protein